MNIAAAGLPTTDEADGRATSFSRKRSSISFTRRCRSTLGRLIGREQQVLAYRHVRKQSVILKNVPAPSLLRGPVHARFAIEQKYIVDQDTTPVRSNESGDAVENKRLPCPAGTEQNRDAPFAPRTRHPSEKAADSRAGANRLLIEAWIIESGPIAWETTRPRAGSRASG